MSRFSPHEHASDYTDLSRGGFYGGWQFTAYAWWIFSFSFAALAFVLRYTKHHWYGQPNCVGKLYSTIFGSTPDMYKERAEAFLEVLKTLKGVLVFWLVLDPSSFLVYVCNVPPPLIPKEPFSGAVFVSTGGTEGRGGPLPCHPEVGFDFSQVRYVGVTQEQYMNATGFSAQDVSWMLQACEYSGFPTGILYGFAIVLELLCMIFYIMVPPRHLFSHYNLHSGIMAFWALYWGPIFLTFSRFRTDRGYQATCIAPNLTLGSFTVGLIYSGLVLYLQLTGLHTSALRKVASWVPKDSDSVSVDSEASPRPRTSSASTLQAVVQRPQASSTGPRQPIVHPPGMVEEF